MSRIIITTPSRLHFGLLGWGPEATRQFGGVGLMVDRPGLELTVERARDWSAQGPLSSRAVVMAGSIAAKLGSLRGSSFRIDIRHAPREHVGLGTGTQLGMALARAMSVFAGLERPGASDLARLAERGSRSGIGVHGFEHGGLIVDAGWKERGSVPTHLLHLSWPDSWSVLLVIPDSRPSVHGVGEVEAFDRLGGMRRETTERLCRLVLLGLLPAVLERDLPAFGESLEEIQTHVGSCFAAVQRGPYGNPRSDAIVDSLRRYGMRGVGQSSWGPCLYAFCDSPIDDRERIRRAVIEEFELEDSAVFWTPVSGSGAVVTLETP